MNDSDSSNLCDVVPDTRDFGVSSFRAGQEVYSSEYGISSIGTRQIIPGAAMSARCGGRREPPIN